MQQEKAYLNSFLVDVFNTILRIEEDALSKGEFENLSVREMHVIEAVVKLGDNNTSKDVANELNVTQSTLTTAVNTLIKKGILIKKADEKDKRSVRLYTTELAMRAYEHHMQFHEELVDAVTNQLSEEELDLFIKSLYKISTFFSSKNLKN